MKETVEDNVLEKRKLSKKFSGIADILERNKASGKYNKQKMWTNFSILDQSKEEVIRQREAESALLFGLIWLNE